jgi:hypothetical protein
MMARNGAAKDSNAVLLGGLAVCGAPLGRVPHPFRILIAERVDTTNLLVLFE